MVRRQRGPRLGRPLARLGLRVTTSYHHARGSAARVEGSGCGRLRWRRIVGAPQPAWPTLPGASARRHVRARLTAQLLQSDAQFITIIYILYYYNMYAYIYNLYIARLGCLRTPTRYDL